MLPATAGTSFMCVDFFFFFFFFRFHGTHTHQHVEQCNALRFQCCSIFGVAVASAAATATVVADSVACRPTYRYVTECFCFWVGKAVAAAAVFQVAVRQPHSSARIVLPGDGGGGKMMKWWWKRTWRSPLFCFVYSFSFPRLRHMTALAHFYE